MKKKELKAIRHKLITAVEKVLTENNDGLIAKIEKDVKKSIREISKKKSKKPVF